MIRMGGSLSTEHTGKKRGVQVEKKKTSRRKTNLIKRVETKIEKAKKFLQKGVNNQ